MGRRGVRWLVFGLVVALLLATPAWALAAAEGEEAAEHAPGPVDLFLDLGLWTIVVFVILLLVLGKFAWGPILEGLHRRETNIRSALDEAQQARQEAEGLHAQFQEKLAKAGEEIRGMMDAARRSADQLKDEMVAKARGEIQTERERLHREIGTARDQALQDLWNQAANLATVISAKAIRRNLSEAEHRGLVDEALAELKQAGSDWQQQGAGLRL
jgi:F-type H+-transporting ATPase subunit b